MTIAKKVLGLRYRLLACILLGKYITRTQWENTVTKQTNKGLAKYGHTLDVCPIIKYNWADMALEELVDFFSYRLKGRG